MFLCISRTESFTMFKLNDFYNEYVIVEHICSHDKTKCLKPMTEQCIKNNETIQCCETINELHVSSAFSTKTMNVFNGFNKF